jgi:regulator of protease activity HflC (stomatin/prohibitin superfamily)
MNASESVAGSVSDLGQPMAERTRWWRRSNRGAAAPLDDDDATGDRTFLIGIGALLVALLLVLVSHRVVVSIPAGHQGVLYRRLTGTDLRRVFPEGTQVIFPWNRMVIYDIRVLRRDMKVRVLSTDGLQIDIALSARYHPESKTLPRLHQAVGPDYAERIVVPEVTAAVRAVMSQYRPQQLFTIRTDEMEGRIIELSAKQARERFVTIDDVLIVEIILPEVVQSAIQAKLRQEQEAEEYRYRLVKEDQEAQRKAAEAKGIAEFQRIVSNGISPNLLRWRGIEATLELAKSPNSKVIVVGSAGGLPLILDTSTATSLTPPAPGGTSVTGGLATSPVVTPAAPPARGPGQQP